MSSKKAQNKALAKEAAKEEVKKEAFVLKPKKPTSAWIYFNTETVAKLKTERALDQKDAFAKSAEIWKEMTEAQKEKYVNLSKKDEERYQK
jgi:HMG (high mobility group) box